MALNWLICDVSTAPITDAATYLDGTVSAPSNYKDPEKIAAYIAEKEAERLAMAATDIDLARITGIGLRSKADTDARVFVLQTEEEESAMLADIAIVLKGNGYHAEPTLVGYGSRRFDWPILMRRAKYLGVKFPIINCDRYRSPHLDMLDILSASEPSRSRPLGFYVKRLGMGLVKPLSGADEALVPSTGLWDELRQSLAHDVEAVYRLSVWAGLI